MTDVHVYVGLYVDKLETEFSIDNFDSEVDNGVLYVNFRDKVLYLPETAAHPKVFLQNVEDAIEENAGTNDLHVFTHSDAVVQACVGTGNFKVDNVYVHSIVDDNSHESDTSTFEKN